MTTSLEDLTKSVLVETKLEPLKTNNILRVETSLYINQKIPLNFAKAIQCLYLLSNGFRSWWKFFRISSEIWT